MNFEIGQKAPAFEGKDQDGKIIKLSDYKGKKVVLFFYPADNTPTCTVEACNLRDNYDQLIEQGYEVVGISTDGEKSHQKFINKFDLPYRLIADTDRKIHDLYDTWKEKSMFGKKFMGTVRTTFVIDENGNFTKIIEKVKSKDHANQILN
ncbi:thioredoxin-dependent thiol peroxidase [Fulvivirgaceae bacterium BMA10]|uniref:thioredoxin-dependent peroxiredoxin n=1 Tax=Splendidivirga corallicola TaxID=3051826 RepID=A0ABT8KH37_9BACT|nr:thioredoxin-dependent thiol peroxidase [Fulvivirgaceae bacterium BMA10]